MITAVDTNIILDILIPGGPFIDDSKRLLDRHFAKGKLIICDVVFAELAAWFPFEQELKLFLTETGIRLLVSSEKSLYIAGSRWAKYAVKRNKKQFSCGRCGHSLEVTCPQCQSALSKRMHVLGDFLIGAHALINADCLLSRDLGVYRTYFSDLKVVGT